MTEQAFFWIAGIMAVIIGWLGVTLWSHVIACGKIHERIAALEVQVKNLLDDD